MYSIYVTQYSTSFIFQILSCLPMQCTYMLRCIGNKFFKNCKCMCILDIASNLVNIIDVHLIYFCVQDLYNKSLMLITYILRWYQYVNVCSLIAMFLINFMLTNPQ
jgi:hypothetical protein